MGAIAQIMNVNFPLRMPGELITGEVTLTNVGDEPTSEVSGFFSVLITTLWNGQEYQRITYSNTAPGQPLTFPFLSVMGGIGTMPEGDAVIEVVAQTRLAYEVYRVDDVKKWDLSEGVPPPEYPPPYPNPLLPLLLIAALALILYRR